MIDKKNDLKTKPLITKKLLNTDIYNIKATYTGMGKPTNIPVSQVFLDFGKGKKIEDYPPYLKSNELLKKLTNDYTLYDDEKADKLMKKYPEFYDMYKNVEHPVMKVDILRIMILYDKGGFFIDLDVIPFTKNLNNETDDILTIWRPHNIFNWEVMYSPKKNEYLLDFLRYAKKQIQIKNKVKIYSSWKNRYILQTTGPLSFKRYLKEYPTDKIQFKEINRIATEDDIKNSIKNKDKFPFFTLGTVSWIEKDYTEKKVIDMREKLRDNILKGTGKDKFIKQLEDINYPVNKYINDAKKIAKKEGYDPNKLSYADNDDNKLKYDSPDGIKYFGKAGYGDFLIWSHKEKNGDVKKGYSKMKKNVFRKSHGAITKMYNLDKYSPNELSIKILW
jgi:hypothetical protein